MVEDHNHNHNQEQQFMEAYEKYSDAIFRYCYYRVFDREKAKDYVQEAYCRTWKYISQGKQIDNLRAFIYRTANNIIIDEVRKKKSTSLDQIMEKGFMPSVDPRKKTENEVFGKEILDIVKSLDEKYRDVILLKYVEDLSAKEIATILNETENNVYVRINRGFQKIKEVLHRQQGQLQGK
jgi:RNA polymerase sigma-70 factor, ECF subfamily